MDFKQAVKIAELWESGKMIGWDVGEVAQALLEGTRELKKELKTEWLLNHDERCANLHTCSTFQKSKQPCCHKPPKIIADEI